MGNLGKRFRRELAASPKKAAVLGLLALVAMYYWAPLVWGWVGKGKDKSDGQLAAVAAPTPSAAEPAPAATPKSAATKTGIPSLPWQQVIKLMEGDARTLAAELGRLRRDPFALPKPDVAKVQAEAAAAAEAAGKNQLPAVTPQGLGLSLSSTIVGSGRRVARIGGRSYEQGQTIQVRKDGQIVAFTLAEVHARRVVLVRDNKTIRTDDSRSAAVAEDRTVAERRLRQWVVVSD